MPRKIKWEKWAIKGNLNIYTLVLQPKKRRFSRREFNCSSDKDNLQMQKALPLQFNLLICNKLNESIVLLSLTLSERTIDTNTWIEKWDTILSRLVINIELLQIKERPVLRLDTVSSCALERKPNCSSIGSIRRDKHFLKFNTLN